MNKGKVGTSSEQIREALQKGKLLPDEPSLETIRYNGPEQLFILKMSNGRRRFIAREELQGLGEAKKKELSNIEILGSGTGVYWPDLDVSFGVSELLDEIYGSRKWMTNLERSSQAKNLGSGAKSARSTRRKSKQDGTPVRRAQLAVTKPSTPHFA